MSDGTERPEPVVDVPLGSGWDLAWSLSKLAVIKLFFLVNVLATALAAVLAGTAIFYLPIAPALRALGFPVGLLTYLLLRREVRVVDSWLVIRFFLTTEERERLNNPQRGGRKEDVEDE